MSELLKKMKLDLKATMKYEIQCRKEEKISVLNSIAFRNGMAHKEVVRSIISMFPEIGIKPDKATDKDVIKLLKKYLMNEKTRALYQQKILTEKDVAGLSSKAINEIVKKKIYELGDKLTSGTIYYAKSYLPPEVKEETIYKWIVKNIDFSKFKNKMQAMGIIMKQFKDADGNLVKKILLEM